MMKSRNLASWPSFDDAMTEAAAAVLRSGHVNYWTGDEGRAFEREFAEAVGAKHAVAVANGTVALEAALHGLGIGPGDEVIVPSRTFIATASAVVMQGATPVAADVDPVSQNLTVDTVARAVTPQTRAVIAVHLAGWPCDVDPIMDFAASRDIKVVEDCAQAHGASCKGRPIGSLGHAAAFSFCQDKIMTTGGEGGMLVTNDEEVWSRAWAMKDHGKNWNTVYNQAAAGVFKWTHDSFGTNWRMTEMQAAIGRVQLRRLGEWVDTRRRNARVLHEAIAAINGLRSHAPASDLVHSYYKFYAFVEPARLQADWSRDRIARALQKRGVPCGSGACPEIYREAAFTSAGLGPRERLPNARVLGEQSLMLPVHPTLSEDDMHWIADQLRQVLRSAASPGTMKRAA